MSNGVITQWAWYKRLIVFVCVVTTVEPTSGAFGERDALKLHEKNYKWTSHQKGTAMRGSVSYVARMF